jgi:hypothetical protein
MQNQTSVVTVVTLHHPVLSSTEFKCPCLIIASGASPQLMGDVRVTFNEGGTRLFYLWFNTAFVTSGLLQFGKDELDKKRGKVYAPNLVVEVRPSRS